MEINIVEKVRNFVEEECKKHALGMEIYMNHFIPVVNYSKKLANQNNLDLELIEIAAWFHDIGSIIYRREDHHITGAEIAEKKLIEFNYPENKIQLIKNCILNHRGSINNSFNSEEERIIAEADCLAFFDNLEGYILWIIEGDGLRDQRKIKESVMKKTQNKWNQISSEGKILVKDKYEAVKLLFGDIGK
jgi:uncharacterized protein